MKYKYTCHRCRYKFESSKNARIDNVVCPCCKQIMSPIDITDAIDDTPAQPTPVASQPMASVASPAQPASAMAQTVQAAPVTPQPTPSPQPVNGDDNLLFCSKCGTKQRPGEKFCPNCGAPFAIPAGTTTDSAKPVINNPTVAQPVQARIITANAVQAQPIQAQPIQAQPIQAQPVQAQPIQAQPVQAQPVQAQPVQAQPVQAQPVQTRTVQAQPVQAQVVSAQPVAASPIQPQPVPVQSQPVSAPQSQPVEPSVQSQPQTENSVYKASEPTKTKAPLTPSDAIKSEIKGSPKVMAPEAEQAPMDNVQVASKAPSGAPIVDKEIARKLKEKRLKKARERSEQERIEREAASQKEMGQEKSDKADASTDVAKDEKLSDGEFSLDVNDSKSVDKPEKEDKPDDKPGNTDTPKELDNAFDYSESEDEELNSSKKKMIMIAVICAVLAIGVAVFIFLGAGKNKDKSVAGAPNAEMIAKNEQAAIVAFKSFASQHADIGLKEYFLLDIDGDGQKEVIANSDKKLIVFGADAGKGIQVYNKDVFEWVWIANKGLFAVFSDNGNTNGSARWMVKIGNTLSVDPDRNYFHFSGSSYYSNTSGKDRKITEEQYYDGINSIIKDYTKLKAMSIK